MYFFLNITKIWFYTIVIWLNRRRFLSCQVNRCRSWPLGSVHQGGGGGGLSLLLWRMATDGLLVKINQTRTYIQSYADDIALLLIGKHDGTTSDIVNGSLNHDKSWCAKEGLKIHPNQTTFIEKTKLCKLILGNIKLNMSSSVGYLVVILDQRCCGMYIWTT